MREKLMEREQADCPIRIGLIGAGQIGLGIVWQITHTPGITLAFIADSRPTALEKAKKLYKDTVPVFQNPHHALDNTAIKFDIIIEATTAILDGAYYCLKAMDRQAHIILVNAELDLLLGAYLRHYAKTKGVLVSSDPGDQHGVLLRRIEEIELWGFNIVQAGNIKGVLNRYATATPMREIAKKLHLDLTQCVAQTDGTKLNIEMSLVANATGLIPSIPGMQGPRAQHVTEALDLFDFDTYAHQGHVDYILGAEPGGGIYVIGRCDDLFQKEYLQYYKVKNHHPYYLFYRPYHLCHIEIVSAIVDLVCDHHSIPTHYHPLTNVYAHAKQPLPVNQTLHTGIGGDNTYGLIDTSTNADLHDKIPIALLNIEKNNTHPRIRHAIDKDLPLSWSDIDWPDSSLLTLYKKQQELTKENASLIQF